MGILNTSFKVFNIPLSVTGAQLPDFAKGEHKNSRAIKGAPLGSLFAQFCLHSLWVGSCNIRGMHGLFILLNINSNVNCQFV